MAKKLEINHASQILTNDCQILVLSQLSNYYCMAQKILTGPKYFWSCRRSRHQSPRHYKQPVSMVFVWKLSKYEFWSYKQTMCTFILIKPNLREQVLFSRTDFLPWEFLLVKKSEFDKPKPIQYTTFKTDIIKGVLVFSISNFFINKNSQGRKSVREKKYLLLQIQLQYVIPRTAMVIHTFEIMIVETGDFHKKS